VKTFDYLFGPGATMQPAAIAAVAIALLCGLLSPLVVLKRMAFIGQGVSHAAFGGIGIAAVLGLFSAGAMGTGTPLPALAVVGAFCIGSALLIGSLSRRSGVSEDTAIGVLLVASMALGFLLLQVHRARPGAAPISVESVLFGDVATTGPTQATTAWIVLGLTGLGFWLTRRSLLFWAFDEPMAETLGVRVGAVRAMLMVLLAIAIVITMQLAGVILATAMLVLPGAAATQLSKKLGSVVGLSVLLSLFGVVAGLVISFETDWQPGPNIALVYVAIFAASRGWRAMRR
jgi:zinc transport system permease protein